MEKIQTQYGEFVGVELNGISAQQVYQEWLANKNKPPQLTELELLQQKTQMLESALLDLANEIGGV